MKSCCERSRQPCSARGTPDVTTDVCRVCPPRFCGRPFWKRTHCPSLQRPSITRAPSVFTMPGGGVIGIGMDSGIRLGWLLQMKKGPHQGPSDMSSVLAGGWLSAWHRDATAQKSLRRLERWGFDEFEHQERSTDCRSGGDDE